MGLFQNIGTALKSVGGKAKDVWEDDPNSNTDFSLKRGITSTGSGIKQVGKLYGGMVKDAWKDDPTTNADFSLKTGITSTGSGIKEAARVYGESATQIGDIAKGMAQGTAQSFYNIGAEINSQAKGGGSLEERKKNFGKTVLTPSTPFEKFLLGDKPFSMTGGGQDLLKTFGASDKTAQTWGAPIGFALSAADVFFGGGKKEGLETLIDVAAKTNKAEKMISVVNNIRKYKFIPIDEVDSVVEALTKSNKPSVIRKIVNGYNDVKVEAPVSTKQVVKEVDETIDNDILKDPGILSKENREKFKGAVKTKENASSLREKDVDRLVEVEEEIASKGGRSQAPTALIMERRDIIDRIKAVDDVIDDLPSTKKTDLTPVTAKQAAAQMDDDIAGNIDNIITDLNKMPEPGKQVPLEEIADMERIRDAVVKGKLNPTDRILYNESLARYNLKQGLDVTGDVKKIDTLSPQATTPVSRSLQGIAEDLPPSARTLPEDSLKVVGSYADDITELNKGQFYNVDKLNVSKGTKEVVLKAVDDLKSFIEKEIGSPLTNQQFKKFAERNVDIMTKVTSKEETMKNIALNFNTRRAIANMENTKTVTAEFIELLKSDLTYKTDAGRTLQALKETADPKDVSNMEFLLRNILKQNANTSEIVNAAKGVNFDNYEEATRFYRKFVAPRKREWVDLLRYNSMLSSPLTHIVNISSNLVNSMIVAPIEKALLGGFDFLGSSITGNKQKYFAGESAAYIVGYIKNVKQATFNMAEVFRGNKEIKHLDMRNIDLATDGVKGKIYKTLAVPTRALEAMDQFFVTLTRGAEETAINYKKSKGIDVPFAEIEALNRAEYRVFRQDLFKEGQGTVLEAVDHFTALVMRARNSDNIIVSTISKFTIPFIKTPMNIFKQGLEYSPIGFVTLFGNANKTEQFTKAVMGTAIFTGAAVMLTSNRMTWAEPKGEKEKARFRAAGRKPYSFKIGNRWVSYNKLPPALSFPFALVASLDDLQKQGKLDDGFIDATLSAVASYGTFLTDQTYLKSVGDLLKTTEQGEAGVARWISNYPQQLIPFRALTGWIARLSDEYQRKVDPEAGFFEKQIQTLMLNYPGLSDNVPARLDPEGNPQINPDRVLNAFSPFATSAENPEGEELYQNSMEIKEAVGKFDKIKKEDNARINPIYEQVQKLVEEGKEKEAGDIVYDLSDEDYAIYKKIKSSEKSKNAELLETKLFTTVKKVQALVAEGKESDARDIVYGLSNDEYKAYKLLKSRLGLE